MLKKHFLLSSMLKTVQVQSSLIWSGFFEKLKTQKDSLLFWSM